MRTKINKKTKCLLLFSSLCLILLAFKSNFPKQQFPDNNYKLISITDNNTYDLSYLDTILKEKQVVMLGESAHGIEEYSLVKYRIIKHLHEKLNFNIIAFESGISECAFLDEMKDSLNSKELLEKGIVQVWQTESNIKLMNYIKENNIKIVGIDNQISTKYNSEYLKTAINKYDKIAAEKIYCLDTTINALYFNKELFKDEPNETKSKFQKNKSELVKIYSEFNSKIDSLLRQKNYSNSQSSLLTLKKVIQNKIYLSQTYLNINKYGTQRDSIMTSNLKWIMDSLAPNKKIIVWAHNSHVSRTGMQNEKSYMGKLISNLLKNQVYSIGLYAYAGETMDVWRRNKIKITKPSTNSIENKLHINDSESKATFINFSKIIDKNNLWTTEKIKAFSWGVRETFIVPSDEYDGAILINVATTPKYIN